MLSQKAGQAKLDHVSKILSDLKADLDAPTLSPLQKKQLLEQLKVYGRTIENADPIFTEDGIRILASYAFNNGEKSTSQEALRCLANALLLQPKARQIFVDLGHGPHAAKTLQSNNTDDEFLASRILFLTTYNATLDFNQLIRHHQLADNINDAVSRHAKYYSRPVKETPQGQANPMDLMALSETLKLLFNITHFHPALSEYFSISIPKILDILAHRDLPNPPLEAPVNHLVNALLNLDLEDKLGQQQLRIGHNAVFPQATPTLNIENLITILDKAISSYPENELDNTIAPVLTLIRRIYEIAPNNVKAHMQVRILPSPEERDKPLGKSDTLSSRLLNLSTSALTPNLRGSISAMMFELSSKDASTFVQNVGYGFASGFLMSNSIPIPENATKSHPPESSQQGIAVNPITGQRLDREEPVQTTPMTQEEKEREAERLFVLFERLKATGVMDVKNPVEEAYRSGRIQELPDESD